ncbi:hypothetical protein DFH08DRAFT_822323 [Mycena albidolilacea]|uniref:Uncharacterized protein n=1 Tax=Mycena albidolilacea TaxID=1033008 RepID=A0AAD7ECF9_9AGAR|nr:hypothetical protein DFH08DRAFT_822323 [Mycena albidolilacea]
MITGEYDLRTIPEKYHRYNQLHPCLTRLNDESFLIRFDDGTRPSVIADKQVQLFVIHNMRLHDASLDLEFNPYGYRAFVVFFNACDGSGYNFAYYSKTERRIKFPTAQLCPASLLELQVTDRDIEPGEKAGASNRAQHPYHGVPVVDSIANLAALSKKRRAQDTEFLQGVRDAEAAELPKKRHTDLDNDEIVEKAARVAAPADSPVVHLPVSTVTTGATVGSRSKINHSVTVNCRYQDINADRTFFPEINLSWHQVGILAYPRRPVPAVRACLKDGTATRNKYRLRDAPHSPTTHISCKSILQCPRLAHSPKAHGVGAEVEASSSGRSANNRAGKYTFLSPCAILNCASNWRPNLALYPRRTPRVRALARHRRACHRGRARAEWRLEGQVPIAGGRIREHRAHGNRRAERDICFIIASLWESSS